MDKIVGIGECAVSNNKNDVFKIGKKNLNIIKESLAYMGLRYNASETGGRYSRTLEMDISNGNIKLTLQPIKI